MGNLSIIRWLTFFGSILFALLVRCQDIPDTGSKPTDGCPNRLVDNDRSVMLVSTLDGKVSALNLEENGKLEWSLDVGSTPLLSSSISKIEIIRDGVPVRLIPSLDGALYEFDGEGIQALPFTADTLLSSSSKFNDNSIVVGGKQTVTYGLNSRTGKLMYYCAVEGCINLDEDAAVKLDSDETLVISRNTKTVRVVDMRTGIEKWNFSVGLHEISLVKTQSLTDPARIGTRSASDSVSAPASEPEASTVSTPPHGDDEAYVTECGDEYTADDRFDFSWLFAEKKEEMDIKILVPNGMVLATSKVDPDKILWQYKFESPIAGAWRLTGDEVSPVSIFDDRNVPALVDDDDDEDIGAGSDDIFPQAPLLYVGIHQNQMYVQPSKPFSEQVLGIAEEMSQPSSTSYNAVSMPRVRWNPYLATVETRTRALKNHMAPMQITWEDPDKEDKNVTDPVEEEPEDNVHITDQYPFDGGYYLYPDTSFWNKNTSKEEYYFASDITITLWNWWREVLLITIATGVMVHVFTVQIMKSYRATDIDSNSKEDTPQTQSDSLQRTKSSLSASESNSSIQSNTEYVSRFYNEFEQKACLGRGGFGVVFESRNKMDDCSYAIKRITLNNSDRAREKVMREVKALAKLDHSGIVRYYQAWYENPPAGWQEEMDRQVKDIMPSGTPTAYSSDGVPSQSFTPRKNFSPKARSSRSLTDPLERILAREGGGDFIPPGPFEGFTDSSYGTKTENSESEQKKGSSGGFEPNNEYSNSDDSSEDSNSFGIVKNTLGNVGQGDSFSIEFINSESESCCDQKSILSAKSKVPFNRYGSNTSGKVRFDFSDKTNDSLDIVFVDSGCAEKNSDMFYDDMEEASGQLSNTQESSWIEHEGIRNRRAHSKIEPVHNRTFLEGDSIDSGNKRDWYVGPSQTSPTPSSSSPSRPRTLNVESSNNVVVHRSKPTPVPKLYLYIQMQLCRRESLKDWLNANTLSRDRHQLLDIFDQILCAVDYIHDSGLMHRDLKPSNIFFSLDGLVKVGDFGLVTCTEEQCLDEEELGDSRCGFNRHTDQVGTKMYMSPEQAEGRLYSNKVDIYSLGLIFFELLYPFNTQMERIKTLMEVGKGQFPVRFQRELPQECELVKDMLKPNPEERPGAKELLRHALLQDFEVMRQALARTRSRHRTISTCSSSSGSNGGLSP